MSTPHLAPRAARPPIAPLVLASLVLLGSLATAGWLLVAAPEPTVSPSADELIGSSDYAAYGGDAFTGIQNAAADTANSVVEGTNTQTDLASRLHEASAEASDAHWLHLYRGLAVLLVLLGVANLGRTLQRAPRSG